ncbi:MAG: redox-sensing transcriptional repressor Rex [Fervidobacterium sp.]|nr:redox-sensing transcriptional repressor Rex [Fervidobacterium sp.]
MKIPKPTVKRLGLYYRCLLRFKDEGVNFVSSQDIAHRLNIKPSQVRKDLSYFGEFGKRGLGYNVKKLVSEIAHIIGVNKEWNVAIIGAGNLGSALANYPGLVKHKFRVVAIFDNDNEKVGKKIGGITVSHINELKKITEELNIEIAVVAVPENSAQIVVEQIESVGIKGIVNFSPVKLKSKLPVEDVDITLSFETLAYSIIKNFQSYDGEDTEEKV